MKHNYKVGDKVVIIEDAHGAVGIESLIGKVGEITCLSSGNAMIKVNVNGVNSIGLFYEFHQFKPYVEEQKPEPKFKVGNVIENKKTNCIFIELFSEYESLTVDNPFKAQYKYIHGDNVGNRHDWKLYEYGVGDEIELLTDHQAQRPLDYYITLKGKYTIAEINESSIFLKQRDHLYLINNLCDFTLIKSARWTRGNEIKSAPGVMNSCNKCIMLNLNLIDGICKQCIDINNKKKQEQEQENFVKPVTPIPLAHPEECNADELKTVLKKRKIFGAMKDQVEFKDKPKIRWEYKKGVGYQGIDEIWGYIENDKYFEIQFQNYMETCVMIFELFDFKGEDGGILIDTFSALKKAKKYALKHYMENGNE